MTTSYGQLHVRVYTSQAELPVEGATVAVTQKKQNGKLELLTVQVTNSSGIIRPIDIETPVLQDSTQPFPGELPFTVCDVWAEHPAYATLLVEGVQIFPGVATIQPMELLPLSEGQNSLNQTDLHEIPPQSL